MKLGGAANFKSLSRARDFKVSGETGTGANGPSNHHSVGDDGQGEEQEEDDDEVIADSSDVNEHEHSGTYQTGSGSEEDGSANDESSEGESDDDEETQALIGEDEPFKKRKRVV